MEDGIFFNQSKYIKEILKKFGLEDSKPMKTPMSLDTKLTKDEECESIDSTKYRGMIGSLLYLMASRLDIMFSVCLCARFQEDPKTSHLEAVNALLLTSGHLAFLSSHYVDEDDNDNDEGTSHASTPSPIRFVNSFSNDIPQVFSNPPDDEQTIQNLFTRQTKILNQVQMQDEHRSGLRSIGKGIKNLWKGKKNLATLFALDDRSILSSPNTRKDYGTKRGRLSTSASSAFDYTSSSHHIDDDKMRMTKTFKYSSTLKQSFFGYYSFFFTYPPLGNMFETPSPPSPPLMGNPNYFNVLDY
ncbi:hypothetical protein Tco_0072791 [Tanacetum coccineum]